MQNKIRFRSISTTRSQKPPVNLSDKRPGNSQTFLEQTSVELSPVSAKYSKLEPTLSTRRIEPLSPLRAMPTSRKGTTRIHQITNKTIYSSNRSWRSQLESELTPKEDLSLRNLQVIGLLKVAEEQQVRQIMQPPRTRMKSRTLFRANTYAVDTSLSGLPDEGGDNKLSPVSPEKASSLRSLAISKPSPKRVIVRSLMGPQSSSEVIETSGESSMKLHRVRQDVYAKLPFRKLIFSPRLDISLFQNHIMEVHKSLQYATKNLKSPSEKFVRSKQLLFPDSITKKAKTLLLDLDETLVHLCSIKDRPDVVLTYQVPGDSIKQIPLKIRPYVREFLARVSPLYEVAVFSASAPLYAKAIVDYIDKENRIIQNILTRDNCMETKNGFFIKDLRIIKNRELKDIIIVDNLAHSFGLQIDNGVPILEFIDDKKDEELKYLTDYLLEAYHAEDVREFNRDKLRLKELAEEKMESLTFALQPFFN